MAAVVYSPKSLEDIERIHGYIRDVLLNPPAADRIVSEIFKAGDLLCGQPRPGAPFRSSFDLLQYYRYLLVERYLIVFRFEKDTIKIVRVLHELQDAVSALLGAE